MIHRIILFLLLTIPLSFKVEVYPGFRFLIQEPFLLIFLLSLNFKNEKVNIKSVPFIFLSISLLIILISSVASLFIYFDPVGTIKTLKYLLYVSSIIVIINKKNLISEKTIKTVLNISTVVIFFSLFLYFIRFLNSGLSWSYYISFSTWNSRFMPTGFSNLTFNLLDFSFYRSGGNHGIYGSYIGLMLIFAIRNLLLSSFKKSKLLCLLIIINLAFITSRESILLLIITLLIYVFHHFLTKTWIQKNIFLISGLTLLILAVVFVLWQPEIVILNKINHMVKSFNEGGSFDRSAYYRFHTWYLFFGYLFAHPWLFLTGIGFNKTRLGEILNAQENALGQEYFHVDLPESFYVTTLGYGGVLSLIFGILFLLTIFYICYQKGGIARIFSFFLIGLTVTNLTSASMLADLFLSQLGIIYAYVISVRINKSYD